MRAVRVFEVLARFAMDSNPYILGGEITAEGQRLLEQGHGLEAEANWLLDRIRVQPGWRALDAGCGPLGILDLLAERVGLAGEVIGLERDSRLIEMGQSILAQRGLGNVRFVLGDAYKSKLPRGSFDLVHTRLLLINLQEPERALAELTALVRPGGIVAVQDIDQVPWLCEPPHPAWEALISTFLLIWRANGLDPLIGHRLPAMLRVVGLRNVQVEVHGRVDRPCTYHRKHLLALIAAIRDQIFERGIFKESELTALTTALERHLDAQTTLVTRPLLFQAWGTKPA
jgi:SAM-dependent methyltransferase